MHLAAAHCLNEQTLDLQSAARQTHRCAQLAALWPSSHNPVVLQQQLPIFSSEWVLPGTNCDSLNYPGGIGMEDELACPPEV